MIRVINIDHNLDDKTHRLGQLEAFKDKNIRNVWESQVNCLNSWMVVPFPVMGKSRWRGQELIFLFWPYFEDLLISSQDFRRVAGYINLNSIPPLCFK